MKEENRKYWINYNGAVYYDGPAHTNDEITRDDAMAALSSLGGYFVRYTSDFDKKTETEWWWCIKDSPVDLGELKANKRRDIRICMRNCTIIRLLKCDLKKYAPKLADCCMDVFATYPNAYRPNVSKKDLEDSFIHEERDVFVALTKQEGNVAGFSICRVVGDTVDMSIVRVSPQFNKYCVSAGIVYELCNYYINEKGVRYISDGQRNVRHETNFQSFLISTLGFRKAYCDLHILYTPKVYYAIKILYPLKKMFSLTKNLNGYLYNIYCALEQEHIFRSFKINN